MGYTRYWEQTGKPITQEFIDKINEILADCKSKGICIKDGNGENEPIVTMDKVIFNGNADKNLDHESFYISNGTTGFQFCKTARKPYDYAVRQALKVAEEMGIITNVSSDGDNDEIISDAKFLGEEPLNTRQFPVVVHYSFDSEVPVWLFDTEKDACDEIKRQFDEEVRIDTEENGHEIGSDMEIEIADDNSYAKITIWYDTEESVTEWSLGDLRN